MAAYEVLFITGTQLFSWGGVVEKLLIISRWFSDKSLIASQSDPMLAMRIGSQLVSEVSLVTFSTIELTVARLRLRFSMLAVQPD
jgi:hypothetical protein